MLKCCVTKWYFLSTCIVGHQSRILFIKSVLFFNKHILGHDKKYETQIHFIEYLTMAFSDTIYYSSKTFIFKYCNLFGPSFSWPRLRVKEKNEQGQGHIFIVYTTASGGCSRIMWPLLYAAISIKRPSTYANCLLLNW